MTKMNRRTFVGLSTAALILPTVASAQMSERAAIELVDKLVTEINAAINSGRSEAQIIPVFEDIFSRYADVDTIARYTLGADARSMSQRQLSAYTDAFQGYMARKYGKQFRDLIGGEIKVQDAKTVRTFVEVETQAKLRGSAPFEVSFLVTNRGGKPQFFNMYVEGINLLLTERSEIQALLDKRRGNVDRLIADLNSVG